MARHWSNLKRTNHQPDRECINFANLKSAVFPGDSEADTMKAAGVMSYSDGEHQNYQSDEKNGSINRDTKIYQV